MSNFPHSIKNKRMPVIFENDGVQIQSNDKYTKVYLPTTSVKKFVPWFTLVLSSLIVFSGVIGLSTQAGTEMSMFLIIAGAIALALSTLDIGKDKRFLTHDVAISDDADNEMVVAVASSHDVLGGALAHIYLTGGKEAVKEALEEVDSALEESLNLSDE